MGLGEISLGEMGLGEMGQNRLMAIINTLPTVGVTALTFGLSSEVRSQIILLLVMLRLVGLGLGVRLW